MRLRALLGSDLAGVRNSLLALTLSVIAATVAGLTLVASEDELLRLPGLFAMIPGAIALRGNIFGGLGSRLSTSIHTGTFSTTPRVDTVVGQNVLAALILSLTLSVVLGVLAKTVVVVFGVENTVPLQDYIVVSVVGGLLASVAVLAVTLSLAAGAVRWGWDLDDVNAPLVTGAGDVFTIPALLAATYLVDRGNATLVLALVFTVTAVVITVLALRSGLPLLGRILRESLPALSIAALLSLIGGLIIG
ncbi:MAG: magnesium transporter [Acidimicrobiales bacterium]